MNRNQSEIKSRLSQCDLLIRIRKKERAWESLQKIKGADVANSKYVGEPGS